MGTNSRFTAKMVSIAGLFIALQIPAASATQISGWVDDSGSLNAGGRIIAPGTNTKPVDPVKNSDGNSGKSNSNNGGKADIYEYFANYGCPLPGESPDGDACKLHATCKMPGDRQGIVHNVFRRLKAGGKWERTGYTYCAAPGSQTPEDAEERVADPEPVVTQEEFQKMPIKPMGVTLQPGVNTLKNYNTNVYLSGEQQVLDTQILGRPVKVRATPVSYVYDYGDGTRKGPVKDKGMALSQDAWDVETSTSHRYGRTGDFSVTVTTVYSGEFSVAGGEWQPIDGTATIVSDAQTITVWKTRSGWVQDGCSANPSAWGC